MTDDPERKSLICETLHSHFGGTWEITGTTRSNFSHICFCTDTDADKQMVVKDIVPHLFTETPKYERRALAERLNRRTHRFRELLASFGVLLTEEFMTTIILNGDGALHITSHEGLNCLELLRQNPTDDYAKSIIGKILTSISGVLHQPQDRPIVGLDLQLANFTINSDCRYVDVFPPLYYDEENVIYIVHEPQPDNQDIIDSHVRRKFLTPGTLRRFRHFVREVKPHWGHILNDELERVLNPEMWKSVKSYFDTLPDKEIDKIDGQPTEAQLTRVISNIDVNDLDGFRDIAAAVIPDIPERIDLMKQTFMCLRTPGPGDPPINRIGELTRILKPFTIG